MIIDEIKINPSFTPWEVACELINAEYEAENYFNEKIIKKFFEIEDLRRIGEHLIGYCNAEQNK